MSHKLTKLTDDVLNATAAAALFEAIENSASLAMEREFFTFGAGEEDAIQREFVRRMRRLEKDARAAKEALEARARNAGNQLLAIAAKP